MDFNQSPPRPAPGKAALPPPPEAGTVFRTRLRAWSYTIPWNISLITLGTLAVAFALKSIAIPHGFISGGISGLGLFLYYLFPKIGPGPWYYILNAPIFLLGWLFVSHRFFFYSLYGTFAVGFFLSVIDFVSPVKDPILAVVAGGTVLGLGIGLSLRTLGSTGGTDIIAVILNQKYNFRMGQVFFAFNVVLFSFSTLFLPLDIVLYSLAMTFIAAQITDHFLTIFNDRKMVLIISAQSDDIAQAIQHKLRRGATFLYGRGAYSGIRKKIVLTVVYNTQLKRLEEIIFSIDPQAFTIIGNTWNVLGSGFSQRKVY